jgi:hypothetical protein
METAKGRIVELTQEICDFYHDRVSLEEAIKLMRDQNIHAEFVRGIYTQLSADADNLIKERYYYFDINDYKYSQISYWTSRYLLIYKFGSANCGSHKIKIVDLFNNKST